MWVYVCLSGRAPWAACSVAPGPTSAWSGCRKTPGRARCRSWRVGAPRASRVAAQGFAAVSAEQAHRGGRHSFSESWRHIYGACRVGLSPTGCRCLLAPSAWRPGGTLMCGTCVSLGAPLPLTSPSLHYRLQQGSPLLDRAARHLAAKHGAGGREQRRREVAQRSQHGAARCIRARAVVS